METWVLIFLALIVGIIIIVAVGWRKKTSQTKGSGEYLLDDKNLDARHPIRGDNTHKIIGGWEKSGFQGKAMVHPPPDQYIMMDFTAPPGGVSGLYYSLTFQLRKWEFFVEKIREWIEVSPTHTQYYQLTHKQKDELENKIKQGLTSASQAIADVELLKHDQRKYAEFLRYFGYRTRREIDEENNKKPPENIPENYDEFIFDEDEKKIKKRVDEHSLKAVFIDMVDAHTGDGISMRSIVSRWPTLITDFLKLEDKDMDPDKIKDKLDITKAEGVVLVTKNKLYVQWKKMFGPEIRNRYTRIRELVRSRDESVKHYREWLKPYIARHKMLAEGLEGRGNREWMKTVFVTPAGQAVSMNEIILWTWKEFTPPELQKGGSELLAREPINPCDRWTRETLIFGKKHGLINKYPWITEKWVDEKKEEIEKRDWIFPNKPYYSFFIIRISRTNIKMPDGSEMEDGMWYVNSILVSMNVLFVKLLELKAEHEEMNRYIDGLIGLPPPDYEGKAPKESKSMFEPVRQFFEYFNIVFQFYNRGPYEKNFMDRVTRGFLIPIGQERYGMIVGFIKKKMGIGVK